jgi:alpha-beta hydrolase superfamily lysophospholipase
VIGQPGSSRIGTALLVALLALTVAACRDDSGSAEAPVPETTTSVLDATTTTTGPPGPGDLIEAEELDEPGIEGSVWRVRYRSRSVGGDPVEVSGVVARPDGPAPGGGFPVLSWAHGTTGVADRCAPSQAGAAGVPGLQLLLDAGFVVAATDYEGLGTPGVHPYLVSVSEGRSVLDAVRAARQVVDDSSSSVVVVGHSQGGHAALAAAEIAAEWAPELQLAGTVAIAPAADVEIMMPVIFDAPVVFGFGALIVAGWTDAYPDLEAEEVLTPGGMEVVELAREECLTEVIDAVVGRGIGELVHTPPHELADWKRRIEENTIAADRVGGPVLVVHGAADAVVPLVLSDLLVEGFCEAGVAVEYRSYPGQDHSSVLAVAASDIDAWAKDRLAGRSPPMTCPDPTG